MVHLVDYGMGNLGSVENMLVQLGARPIRTGDPKELARAERMILPGVGAFGQAMTSIEKKGIRSVLDNKATKERIPILGICLGMQLMTQSSEEGHIGGLGWVEARTLPFPKVEDYRVPHMGWNRVKVKRGLSLDPPWHSPPRFYFVHSYFVRCALSADRWLGCDYGPGFDAGFIHGNLMGVQFHPEKSHRFGKTLFQSFLDWDPFRHQGATGSAGG